MVPRSHSRATTSEVSRAPMMVITTAMEPGTRKLRLTSAGLNQARLYRHRHGNPFAREPPPARSPAHSW